MSILFVTIFSVFYLHALLSTVTSRIFFKLALYKYNNIIIIIIIIYHFLLFLRHDSLCGSDIHISKLQMTTRLDRPNSPNNLLCKCFQLQIIMVNAFLNVR